MIRPTHHGRVRLRAARWFGRKGVDAMIRVKHFLILGLLEAAGRLIRANVRALGLTPEEFGHDGHALEGVVMTPIALSGGVAGGAKSR